MRTTTVKCLFKNQTLASPRLSGSKWSPNSPNSPFRTALALRQSEPGDNLLEPGVVAEGITDGIGDHGVRSAAMLLGTSNKKLQRLHFLPQVRIKPGHATGVNRFVLFRRLEFFLPVTSNARLLVRISESSYLLFWGALEFL